MLIHWQRRVLKKATNGPVVPRRTGRRTKSQEKIARDRIDKLLNLASKSSYDKEYEQSKRFVELALMISKRYNQRLTKMQRLQICRKCNSFLDSKTSKNRLSSKGWKIITCLDCGSIARHSLPHSDQ
tara:strand:+ start:310 stop:690 length:381 start_codon:yes stop_codon:yes gene_type:complete